MITSLSCSSTSFLYTTTTRAHLLTLPYTTATPPVPLETFKYDTELNCSCLPPR